MAINRRTFGVQFGAASIFASLPASVAAYTPNEIASYLTTARDRLSGSFKAVCLDNNLNAIWQTSLPDRAHAPVMRPQRNEAVVISRRPGTFAIILDTNEGEMSSRINAILGRHFYGHGVFDQTGQRLFLTENDFGRSRGVIGVYDAEDDYRRIEEFSSGGIGPHEIIIMPDNRALCVANGGIRTHPDYGRVPLNTGDMRPSLQMLDVKTGELMAKYAFADQRQMSLSIRHIVALDANTIVVGCQDQNPGKDVRQLVYLSDNRLGVLRPLTMPLRLLPKMKAYVGAVAIDPMNGDIAASAPRGGLIALWNAKTEAFKGAVPFADGCGLAAGHGSRGLISTSGEGGIRRIDDTALQTKVTRDPFLQWDNHIIRMPEKMPA